MGLTGIDHINIDTGSIEETVEFYAVLGLEGRPKPSGNPGVWLYAGESPLVHVNPVEADGAADTGLFQHVAFNGSDYEALCTVLDQAGIDYKSETKPDQGRAQIFVRDPNGIMVEVTFPWPP